MGTFRIEIQGIGGHGVDRGKKDGEVVDFSAEGDKSPDAIAKACLDALAATGCQIDVAVIKHWPGEPSEVVDDLVTGTRKGNF